ncbi:hypothetical protein [endosymbiont GvMRE of Glomus versiforme]|uniref:hypothetical protein n=1 Tax=endosymbiont GvMRE of Glomus versiforme TaxID=2039283 RepID=UPI0011C4926F|nr:hypothetical protein [endosymbiont GvMRE of Glomus versiforme]
MVVFDWIKQVKNTIIHVQWESYGTFSQKVGYWEWAKGSVKLESDFDEFFTDKKEEENKGEQEEEEEF